MLTFPPFKWSGRIHKILSEKHLDDIIKKIKKIIDKAKKENSFQYLIIDDVIELGIAPKDDKDILQKWADERGLEFNQFSGPSYDPYEINRTKMKIKKEQKQLPIDYPNMIIVNNNRLFVYGNELKKIINELEEELYRYPHLLFAIVRSETMGTKENAIDVKDQHMFIKKTWANLFVEQNIILFNHYCNIKIAPSTIKKIYDAFRCY